MAKDTLKALAKAANSVGKATYKINYDKWGWIDALAERFYSARKRKIESPEEYFKNHSFSDYLKNNKTAKQFLDKNHSWGITHWP